MDETVMNTKALPELLYRLISTEKVRVRELDAKLLTADHHEFDVIEENEDIFVFIDEIKCNSGRWFGENR
ncbi:MAG: hypothetical protein LBV40_01670 [Methanomicrobiales archaeon]|jgi:hypothetical protein|nr:hypothetical protein [Methanomicrobiales archaeon]